MIRTKSVTDGIIYQCKYGHLADYSESDLEPYMKKYPKRQNKKKRKNFKDNLKKIGINHLYHLTSTNNIPSILLHGLLSRNELNRMDLKFDDHSPDSYLKRGMKNMLSNYSEYMESSYDENIFNFVRLSFAPHIPYTRSIFFGKKQQHKSVLIQINLALMDELDVYFTNYGCLYPEFELYSSSDELNELDCEIIKSDLDKLLYKKSGEEKDTIKRKRSAEVLISQNVPVKYFEKFIVFSHEAKDRLLSILSEKLNKNKVKNPTIHIDHHSQYLPAFTHSSAYQHKIYGRELYPRYGNHYFIEDQLFITYKKIFDIQYQIKVERSLVKNFGFNKIIEMS